MVSRGSLVLTGDCKMTMNMVRTGVLALGMVFLFTIGGCRLIPDKVDHEEIAHRLERVPPIRLDSLEGRHMLVMQAPNPGWTLRIDKDERDRDGWVLFITVREPDPAYMHPQRVVEKRLLSEIETDHPIKVMARLLGAHEIGDKNDYGVLETVEQFTP